MWLPLVLFLTVLLLAVVCKVYLGLFSGKSPNPFSEDVKRPPAPLVTDKEARKKVLKQGSRRDPGIRGCTSGILTGLGSHFAKAAATRPGPQFPHI